IPPLAGHRGEEIYLDLLQTNIHLLQVDKNRPLILPDVYLLVEGALRVRFEKLQVQANLTVVRQALTRLQNHLHSLAPFSPGAPEALFHVPQGGNVEQDNSARSLLSQYIIANIIVREGGNWDQGAIRQSLEQVLAKTLHHMKLQDVKD